MKTKIFLIIITGLLLASCAGRKTQPITMLKYNPNYMAPHAVSDKTIYNAQKQLAESAISIQNSLQELAAIQNVVYPAAKLPDLPDARSIGMGHLASIDWTGPIEPLVKDAAKVSFYKLRVLGKAPAIPILVSLSEKDVPIATILRNAAYQCGTRVKIVVYPRSRTIELRYTKL